MGLGGGELLFKEVLPLPRSSPILREKYPNPDTDQDHAAEDGGFVGELGAEFFADIETAHADDKGDNGN